MEAKGHKRAPRVRKSSERYVMQTGEILRIPSLMGNTPRISGKHTGRDSEFLADNRGKLKNLQ